MSASSVALLLPDLAGGGAERVMLDVAKGLLDRGAEVELVLVRDAGPLRAAVPAGTRVTVLGTRHTSTAIRRLRGHLQETRPRAVVSALTQANVLAVAAARLLRHRIPVIVTHHNTTSVATKSAPNIRERLYPTLARRVYPLADRIVAVSKGVADDLSTSIGLSRDRIDVVYNPVISDRLFELSSAPVEHPWLVDKQMPVLLATGRLTEQKDFPTLLRAFARLPADRRLIVLGDGEQAATLRALADRLGIADRVDMPGFVSNPFPYFAHADVFVLSSRWEGLPTVLIEALPFDVGIVSTDCPSGPVEVLADGRWGRLVPVGDDEALSFAIESELAEPHRREPYAWAPYELAAATDGYWRLLDEVSA